MEIVVVDLAPGDKPALEYDEAAPVKYLRRPHLALWSEARYEAYQHSTGPIVASIEDHAYAAPNWAEAVIEAHQGPQGPWAAVGFAFVNANPETYRSRACLIKDYGPWMHPTKGGPTGFVPGHNISYRRDVLESFGDELEDLFALDFTLQAAIRRRGAPMYVEPRAIVAHENFVRISQMIRVQVAYNRLLAGRRMKVEEWSAGRRLLYAALTPFGSPAIACYRYVKSFAPRPTLWLDALKATPIIVASFAICGFAESFSYLFGDGDR